MRNTRSRQEAASAAGAAARELRKGRTWHGTGSWIGRAGAALTAALVLAGAAACGGDRGPDRAAPGETAAGGPEAAPTVGRTTPEGGTGSARAAATPAEASAGPDSGTRGAEPTPEVTGPVDWESASGAFRDGRYDEAVSLFRAYASQKPDNPWGHYMLGLSAWKARRPQLAEEGFRAALDRDPNHVKSLVNLSRLLLDQDRTEDAGSTIEHALEVVPDDPVVLRVAGNVRTAQGRLEEAEDLYRASAVRDPEQAWSLNDLGLVLVRLGRYDEALAPLARAVTLEPGEPAFQNNLGLALERTGHPDQAAGAYRRALESEPDYRKAQVSLERVRDREPEPGTTPVDLASLAETFTVASRVPVPPDSTGL